MKALLEKIRKILRSRRTRQLLTRAVSGVAAIVVFVTTYALVLPAITLEQNAFCGIPEHQHTDACYEERLVCEIPEGEEHQYDASCYEKFLICGKEVHVHSTECYQQESSAVVSTGSGAAASTALGAFAEPDAYETGVSEFASGAAVMDNTVSGGSITEEPAEEETASVQAGTGEFNDVDSVSDGLDTEETDGTGRTDAGAADSETVSGSSDNDSNGLEDTKQESLAGEGDIDLAADSSQDAAGTNLENPENGSSEGIDADTTKSEAADNKDSEEDGSAADTFEGNDSAVTEQVNNENEGLSLNPEDSMDINEGFDSDSDIFDASDRAATDSAGVETEDADSVTGTEEAANDATTNVLPENMETEKLSSGFVPELDSIEFSSALNKHTDFFYFHPEEGQEIPASSAEVTEWKKVKNGLFGSTKLESTDMVKMYLSYTVPAGALNETNQVARYRLPSNIHLTDDQIIAINSTENGMSALYADTAVEEDESAANEADENTADDAGDEARAEGLESDSKVEDSAEDAGTASGTDGEDAAGNEAVSDTFEQAQDENAANYQKYLGAEAIEGTRTPDEKLKDGGQEYISAIVKAENVFDEEGLYGEKGAFLGQDLIFIFTPYSIEKNQTIFNADGDPLSAGEKIIGWFACDFNMSQIDWVEEDTDLDNSTVEKTAEVVFVEKDSEKNVKEISRKLKLVDTTEEHGDAANGGETAAVAETAVVAETAAAAEIAATAATASETAATDEAALASTWNTSERAVPEETENGPFKSGTLTADGDGYRITLDYTEEAKIPENAELSVREITAETDKEAYEACLEQAGQQVAADEKTSVDQKASRFFDIEILVKDTEDNDQGETHKIEPAAPVSVNIQVIEDNTSAEDVASTDKEASQSEPAVLHFAEEGVELIDSTVKTSEEQDDNKDRNGSEKTEPATEISFEAESFSIYGVVYTVDFHYEVDGKMYEFSIPGGGFASFYKIVEVLGISNPGTQSGSGDEIETENGEIGAENGENTDGNAVHNVVEETGVEDTGTYSDAVSLNNVEVSEATKKFVTDVANVEFSSPDLVWVGKVDEETTVGGLKEANELEVQYSAELTEEQIAEINSSTVEGGDWALISLIPFTSEESLTVTMKNGDQFVVKVTDAQEVTSPEATEIDINKAYMICYDDGENYHILHNDGSQDSISKGGFPYVVEYYVSNTTWAFQYVFKEYDREGTEGYNYYLIRSNDDISSTLAIYEEGTEGTELVQPSNNNIALLPAEGGGFYLSGYNGYRLAFEDGKFISKKYNEGDPDTGSVMHIFERETLPQYMLNVSTNNPERGVVWCYYPTQVLDGDAVELGYTFRFDDYATTELYKRFDIMSDSGNESGTVRHIAQDLYAFPWGERGLNNTYRYKFDYWELNGEHLDPDEYPEMIPAGKLEVPYNGSTLIAHFVYDDTFQATDDQKTDSHVDDMSSWLSDFQARRVPLDETKTQKTAEVYDYENRIYRVDLTTKSNLRTFDGSIDLGFSLDVSNSMLFPADLQPYENLSNVQLRTSSGRNRLDTSKTYYIISDRKNRSTVFKIFYSGGSWRYTDASKNESKVIGSTTSFHAVADDNYDNNYTYQMYYANPDSTGVVRDRFYYLNQSLTSITDDLVNIKNTLNIAGANSPSVKAGYNTFNGFVQNGTTWTINGNRVTQGNDRRTLSDVAKITPHFENVAGGGTRPDRAIEDANNLGWTGDTRYLILITDGAPQGGYYDHSNESTDPSAIRGWVRDKAKAIKKSEAEGGKDVKIITIGLSMNDVDEGRKLLYDIADYAPNNGPKMFYLAEKTQDLSNILRQILDLILVDATVEGDITDTVNEAFYLVDKATGLPLQANDTIDIDGNKTSDSTKVAGTVLADGKTVKWNDQIID